MPNFLKAPSSKELHRLHRVSCLILGGTLFLQLAVLTVNN